MKTDPQQLLDLAYKQVAVRIEEFSPGDLNALIKTLNSIKKEDEPTVKASTVGGFLARNKV